MNRVVNIFCGGRVNFTGTKMFHAATGPDLLPRQWMCLLQHQTVRMIG